MRAKNNLANVRINNRYLEDDIFATEKVIQLKKKKIDAESAKIEEKAWIRA